MNVIKCHKHVTYLGEEDDDADDNDDDANNDDNDDDIQVGLTIDSEGVYRKVGMVKHSKIPFTKNEKSPKLLAIPASTNWY